jgi:hypothetical protein
MRVQKRSNLRNLILPVFACLLFAAAARAQSTNQSSPTPLTPAGYTGKGPTKETNYYFNFTGGPGEVTVGLEINARDYSTFARLELWSGNKTLATHNMNAATTTGSSSIVKELNLGGKRTVVIKLTLDANLASYKITLGGAVGGEGSSMASTGGVVKPKLNLSADDMAKLPKPVIVPKSGTLVVRMKDGSSQEFDLATVSSVLVVK